ncbi:MAG TPA: serine hydrolase domain-containing protein, partial [Candidatus Paceibacterota bacterium]|nr:serine hydrolase domain-containing protein [Candidatus Paceibacterota bacterium]
MEDLIRPIAEAAIKERTFPGCVVGIIKRNGERMVLPFGRFTYEDSAPAVRENTLYDLASITKSIPTGSLALQLIDQGKLRITDKLIDHIPEFNNSDRDTVLVKHLLTYTLDGYGFA